jgi:hypothetical protein
MTMRDIPCMGCPSECRRKKQTDSNRQSLHRLTGYLRNSVYSQYMCLAHLSPPPRSQEILRGKRRNCVCRTSLLDFCCFGCRVVCLAFRPPWTAGCLDLSILHSRIPALIVWGFHSLTFVSSKQHILKHNAGSTFLSLSYPLSRTSQTQCRVEILPVSHEMMTSICVISVDSPPLHPPVSMLK